MQQHLDPWLATYRAAGRAESTIRNRRSYVAHALAHLDLEHATPADLIDYLAARRLSPEGRKSMIVSLRSFLTFAYRRGLITTDLAAELPRVTVPRGKPNPASADALARARAIATPETLLMLDLGCLAGLRLHEIAAVHARDVTDFGLRVTGKGGRTRVVPIHPRLRERLNALHGWAFPSPIRSGQHVAPDYVARRIEAVLPNGYTTHSLRHYFATAAFRGRGDIRSVQELLGHASVETTMRYVLVDQDDLMAAVAAVA